MTQVFNIIGLGEVLWDVFPDGPRFGGAPANMACAIAGLSGNEANVTMVSAVGNDPLGREAINTLVQRNIEVSRIRTSSFPTGTVTVNLDESHQASYDFAENCAWDNITWSESLRDLASKSDAICFGSLAQRGETSRQTLQKFINAAPISALKVFDINLRTPFYSAETIIQTLELANVLKLNEEELPIIADMLAIKGDTNDLLKIIQQQFQLSCIALTQGAKGAILLHNDQLVTVPIVPTTVVDTVGAGDSFTAALTLALLQNKPLIGIARYATKVSSYVCSQRGGTPRLSNSLFSKESKMNYLSKEFLQQHSKDILNFYTPRVVDHNGGYFQNYYDDGSLFAENQKQLVSSTRIIVNYALAAINFNDSPHNNEYLAIAKHGLHFLENVHWQANTKSYAWTIINNKPDDMTQQAYGYAFVLLAYAAVKKAGIITSDEKLLATYELLEQRFWQSDYGLYADEISSKGILSDYRGQNSNMHLCEAMIAAYEATENMLFLERAKLLAQNIVVRQASLTDNLIWEHYNVSFQPDWDYNKDDPKNLYRPWGVQPGHQTEWAKLLLILNRYDPEIWLVERAVALYDKAYDVAWDNDFGGLVYGFDSQGGWCDDDKYFWVQAESFATAALLYSETKEQKYLEQYNSIWQYCDQHFVDHKYGAWFRLLKRDNSKTSSEKSSAGAKCDYHTLGACFEVLRSIG